MVELGRMALFLGIDGGGTQTTCAVADETHVLATGVAGGSNPIRFDDEQVRQSLHGAIRQACEDAGVAPEQIEFACLGIAGTTREEARERVERIAREILTRDIKIVGDMVVAHESVFPGKPGAIVLAGTGSIAYGRNERGETARAGGWGSAISDEGSGYWIGRRAVNCLMRAVDSGESTSLVSAILHEWHIASREDLSRMCNSVPPPNFAKLFPLVLRCSESGDRVAKQILDEAAAELAALSRTITRRLWLGPKPVQIAVSGGVFQNSERVRGTFEQLAHAGRPDAIITLAELEPVLGAVYLARQMAVSELRATSPGSRQHS